MKWYYDKETEKLLTWDEYEKVKKERADKNKGKTTWENVMPRVVEKGKWKYDEELGKCVPYHETPPAELHYVIQDTMDATRHPASGETYESKTAFRRKTKELGLVEYGSDFNAEKKLADKQRQEKWQSVISKEAWKEQIHKSVNKLTWKN